MTAPTRPAPGSAAAALLGCRCPQEDNAGGAGWMGLGVFWMRDDCPVHGTAAHAPVRDEQPARVSGDAWGGR